MNIRKIGIIIAGLASSLLFASNVYAQAYGSVKIDTLDVRQLPINNSAIVHNYNKDESVKIIDQISPKWYAIEYSNKETAYVNSEHITVYKVKASITENNVNVRTYPSINAKTIRQFNKDQVISVHYKVGDWYYMSLGHEPFFGFIHKAYIEDSLLGLVSEKDISQVKEIEVAEEKIDLKQKKIEDTINYAKQFLGNPYRYGGTSLITGTDCSGFTQQIMKHAGVSLQRSSAAQYANNGTKISVNNLRPGDLLFYGYKGRVSHVALYIGNSQVIHANDSKTGIVIGNAFPTRGKPYIGAKRVI